MKCPSCGYVSFDKVEVCTKCGADLRKIKEEGPFLSLESDEETIDEPKPVDNELKESTWHLEGQEPGDDAEPLKPGEADAGEDTWNVPDENEQVPSTTPIDETDEHTLPPDKTVGDTIFEGVFDNWESVGDEEKAEEQVRPHYSREPESAKPEEEVSFEGFNIDLDEPFESEIYQEIEETIEGEEPDRPERETILPFKELESVEPVFWKKEPAGFIRRAGAFLVDTMFISLLLMLFVFGTGIGLLIEGAPPAWLIGHFWIGEALLPFFLLASVISGIYFIFCHWNSGGTIGKDVFSIKVVNGGGHNLSFATSFFRWMAYLVSAAPLGLGFFWPLFDHERLSWHDRLTGTMVVERANESS